MWILRHGHHAHDCLLDPEHFVPTDNAISVCVVQLEQPGDSIIKVAVTHQVQEHQELVK